MPEGYVKAVHFATCTLNEDIGLKCWSHVQNGSCMYMLGHCMVNNDR